MEQRAVKNIFESGGWPDVWESLVKKEISPDDAASLAEDMARQLEERPPIDPFWIGGEESSKRFHIPNSIRAKTLVAWLKQSNRMGCWDDERIDYEMRSLLGSKFIKWNMSADWNNSAHTLAESVFFEIPRAGIFRWKWDWSSIRPDWWASIVEYHPSKVPKGVTELERKRLEGWKGRYNIIYLARSSKKCDTIV